MKSIVLAVAALFLSLSAWAQPTPEQPDRNVELYNLENGLGLKGYDPVSYFAEGGGEALQGSASITGEYGGVVYRFASEGNRDLFFENPTKYEPTYGGHCAWARANGAYADIDPTLYTINGNRAHFFIARSAKFQFDADLEFHEANADDSWRDVSGEEPRL